MASTRDCVCVRYGSGVCRVRRLRDVYATAGTKQSPFAGSQRPEQRGKFLAGLSERAMGDFVRFQ